MGFTNVRSDNILRSNNHRYSYEIENLYEPCVIFSGIKVYITLVYICLHLASDSSTLIYIRLWLVYSGLHSSSDSSVFSKQIQLIKFYTENVRNRNSKPPHGITKIKMRVCWMDTVKYIINGIKCVCNTSNTFNKD